MDTRALGESGVFENELRSSFGNRVLFPGDARYDGARTLFYRWHNSRPAAIIRAADEADVSRAVLLARDSGREFAVRGGGHSIAGHSTTQGGIVLDLSEMKGLEVDPERHTAWAQAGLTAGEYSSAVDAHGLATGFGDTGSVGIGGLTLGGGIGYLVRKHGLTVDSLLGADVVTADGRLLRVDAENHPDLFWAIRGGGGNFGVATRFHFRLHEVGTVLGGMLMLPATAGVIASLLEEAQAAPEELSVIANVMATPPMPFVPEELHGKLAIMALLIYAGPVDKGEKAVAKLRKVATPLADMVRPMRYPEIFAGGEEGPHPAAVSVKTLLVDAIDRSATEAIYDHLQAPAAAMRVAQLRVLGGAMARVPAEATAFAHRGRGAMVSVASLYERPEESAVHDDWVRSLAGSVRRGSDAAYVNFLGDEGEARVREAYPGPTWDRLAAVKARYDPGNFFRRNQNVPPAG